MVAFLFNLDESLMSSRKILKTWFTETQGTILGFKEKSEKATTRERRALAVDRV